MKSYLSSRPGAGGAAPEAADGAVLGMAMRLGRLSAWTLDLPQMRLHWSSEALAMHGYDARRHGPLTIEVLLSAIDPQYRSSVEQALQACLSHGTAFEVEALARSQQRAVWMRLIGEAERDAQGHIVRIRGAVQDITEPKATAQRAHETSERLVATLESISDAFFTIDREWRFTYVNREAERLLRRPREQLVGQVLWDAFPEALESAFHREYERALATYRAVEFESHFAPLDLWAQVKAFPSPLGLAVYLRDVTQEHRMRRALSDTEDQHRMLFETSIDAILNARPDGAVEQANPAACALFGMTQAQFRRVGRSGLVAAEDRRIDALRAQRRRTGVCKGDLTMVRGDGSRFEAEITAVDYQTGGGETRSYVIIRDQTERLRARRQIEALNADLADRVRVRTAQLESANTELKAFAHSLAHDLRALIATVERFAAILAGSLERGGSASDGEYLRRIRAAARQMEDFTQALLSLARVSQAPLAWGRVDLAALAQGVLAALQEHDPGRTVAWQVQPGLLVDGDARLLQMALENLLANAWKFTSRRAVAEISFGARTDGGQTVYFVRDNGAGFHAGQAHRLFGTFQRLHAGADFPGTGIGLANVRRIIGRHGGRVWAESVEGEGATFFFTLGAAQDPEAP
ncbi:PAS domain S-box protein [Ramlibacter sp.]|uniref:sensor histidine kinase n=1 Tax=Ramlibacter sp. TaxID=1917967 RepID=UPI002C473A1A|nr:PAS domain S-box protein [Ramlibacter sp.]HWI82191.1 PAS domain S-box protein [Ramlibacter sp.]